MDRDIQIAGEFLKAIAHERNRLYAAVRPLAIRDVVQTEKSLEVTYFGVYADEYPGISVHVAAHAPPNKTSIYWNIAIVQDSVRWLIQGYASMADSSWGASRVYELADRRATTLDEFVGQLHSVCDKLIQDIDNVMADQTGLYWFEPVE